jgi:hypothetical protein
MGNGKPNADKAADKPKNAPRADSSTNGDDELDAALADTFPASDPPAPVSHGTTSNPRPHEKDSDE